MVALTNAAYGKVASVSINEETWGDEQKKQSDTTKHCFQFCLPVGAAQNGWSEGEMLAFDA